MPQDRFVIPVNLKLSQTLKLLYSIVSSQYKNCEEKLQVSNKKSGTTLHDLSKTLSSVLTYLKEGIRRVEMHYQVDDLFSSKDSEVTAIVNDLRILDQDIKNSKKEVESRLSSIEKKRESLSPTSSHVFLSNILKKTLTTSRKKEQLKRQEEKEAQDVEKLRQEKKLEEERVLKDKLAKERELEEQRARMMELTVKQQVEAEVATRLSKSRMGEERGEHQQQKQVSSEFAKPSHTQLRRSLDVKRPARRSTDQMRRRSLDGGARQHKGSVAHSPATSASNLNSASVNRAALLAWSNSLDEKQEPSGRRTLSPEPVGRQPSVKKYEYSKPVVHRPHIRIPKRITPQSKKELVTETGGKERQSYSKKKVPVRTPSLSPRITEKSPEPVRELTPMEARIREVMDNLQGVDAAACEQILDNILILDEKVHWDDIAGLNNAKNSLKETVVYPFLRPDLFKGLREPIRGMLLFGPPGTGKTMIAKAVATESCSTFFSISASSLLSKYLGESEKLVRALFYLAKKLSPSIIFVDEIDSLLTTRSDNENESSRRIKTELLIQWSALSSATAKENENTGDASRVLVLAATNLPWAIDEAARRRFSRRLYIPLPEYETRLYHLKKLLSRQKNNLSDTDFEIIANLTEGYSGSDITSLAKEAAMEPIRDLGDKLMDINFETIRGVCLKDFEKAMLTVKKSVSPSSLERFETWAAGFGSTGA